MPPEDTTTATVAPITPPPVAATAASGFTPSAEDQQLITLFEQAVELDDLASGAAEALADTTATATSAVAAAQDKVNATGDLAASKWRELTEALTVRGRKSKVPAVVNIFTSILIACLALSIGTGCNESHRAPQQSAAFVIENEIAELTSELKLLRADLRQGLMFQTRLLGQIDQKLDQLATLAKPCPCAEAVVKPERVAPPATKPADQTVKRLKLSPCRPRGRCTSCVPVLACKLVCDELAGDPHQDRPLRYWTPIRNLIENLRPVRRALKLFRDPQRAAIYAPSVA